MTNPDLRPYVDLTIYDKTPQDFFNDALTALSVSMPEWIPRENSTEMMLLEAMSLPASEVGYMINRLPNAVVEVLLQFMGVFRDVGQQPNVTLTFTVIDGLGYTIPAGTSAMLNIADGIDPVVFSTDVALVIPVGSTTGTVTATGDRYTQDANSTPTGTLLGIIDTLQYVDSIAITGFNTQGRDVEDDSDWIARGTQRFSELSEALTLARQFQAAALEYTEVSRANAIDNYNPASGHPPGEDGGYIYLAVYGDNAFVDSTDKATILADLQSRAQANLAVNIADATIEVLPVTVTVVAVANYDSTQLQTNIQTALQNYLSYQTWDWSQTVYRNALISVIGNAEGVAYVQTLTAPAADTTYTDVAPLVTLGTLTVTIS